MPAKTALEMMSSHVAAEVTIRKSTGQSKF